MAKWNGQVPFDPESGDLQHYPTTHRTEWRDNCSWEGVLKFTGFSRGRSAAYADFQTADGTSVTMFLTDFSDVVKQMVSGCLIGCFTYCKRGQNFGVKMVSPVPK